MLSVIVKLRIKLIFLKIVDSYIVNKYTNH